jgi:hypothetical protein
MLDKAAMSWPASLFQKFPDMQAIAQSKPAPVPANVQARYNANAAAAPGKLQALKKAIEVAPFFLCSTHGDYDRSEPLVKRIVPPNTWIFEAQSIGDLTLTTVDRPLWDLLQGGGREYFYDYMMGTYKAITAKGFNVYDVYKEVFKNLILYKPGDEIYCRGLSIGGGRVGVKEGARREYAGMGFFRFDANANPHPYARYGLKKPYEILGRLQAQLVEDEDRKTTDCDLVDYISLINKSAPTFVSPPGEPILEDFRLAWPTNDPAVIGGPKVFFFSSCAAVTEDNTPTGVERWAEIAALQRQRVLESWAMGIRSLGGGAGGKPQAIKDSLIPKGPITRARAKGDFLRQGDNNEDEGFSRMNANLGTSWAMTEGGRRLRQQRSRERMRKKQTRKCQHRNRSTRKHKIRR